MKKPITAPEAEASDIGALALLGIVPSRHRAR